MVNLEDIEIDYVLHGSRRRYTIKTKREIAELLDAGTQAWYIADTIGISMNTLYAWLKDYRDGKLTFEYTIAITRKKLRASRIIEMELERAQNKVRALKEELTKSYDYEHKIKINRLKEL